MAMALSLSLFDTAIQNAAKPRSVDRCAGQTPIPGYELVEPLGRGGFGEVWKCKAPGGFFKAIKFVFGQMDGIGRDAVFATQEWQALEHIKNIRHPYILSTERVEVVEGTLLIVMELADRSLFDLFQECKAQRKPGIPRSELLDYLLEAAEALDLMSFQHGLQHLDIKPQNLFLVSHHVKVADFGLVNRLSHQKKDGEEEEREDCPGVTPTYAAPETLQGKVCRQSDQYSLAIVYQELLTGTLPFKGRTSRQLFLQHLQAQPDLSPLPAEDRAHVARAMSKDPAERFPSCQDFLRALFLSGPSEDQVPDWKKGKSSFLRRLKANSKITTTQDVSPETPGPIETMPPPEAQQAGEGVRLFSLAGYSYAHQIGQTALGELWLIRNATGEEKVAYHLHGFSVEDKAEQIKALSYLQSFQHPALLRFEIAELTPYRIILVLDPWEKTLVDYCRNADVLTNQVLPYLAETAAALDELVVRANLFHLSLNPANIIIGLDGVQLRDFGLVPLLYQPSKDALANLNPGFASPELGGSRPSSASDQYSLASVYAALRSGRIGAKERAHGPAKKPTSFTVDLSQFKAPERKVLVQALDQDPRRRFDSCSEFMQALDQARGGVVSASTSANALWSTQEGFLRALCSWVQDKEKKCGGGYEVLADGSLQQTCAVQLLPGTATLWLCVFVQEWNVSVEHTSEQEYVLFLPATRSFWQKMSRKVMGLRIRLQFKLPEKNKPGLAELTTTITPIGIGRRLMELFHRSSGPDILESVRKCLNAVPERRGAARFPLTMPIHVRHRASGQRPAEFECKTKDVSQTGIGLLSPAPMETGEVRVVLRLPGTDAEAPPIVLRANVKRCQPLNNGWYEIGASFMTDPNKKKQPPAAESAPAAQTASSA